jgi:hypothetical protein
MFIDTKFDVFKLRSMSAARPAQPLEDRVFGIDVCHCSIWSECENNPNGNRFDSSQT